MNQAMHIHSRKCCKILTQVIKEAKHMHYNKQIIELDNKVQMNRKIVKKERGNYCSSEETLSVSINDDIIRNPNS
jgi:preprotein translocase subunit SecA